MVKALIIQSDFDIATRYQHSLLIKQAPVIKALANGHATLLQGRDVTRKNVLEELNKPYSFVYIGSHGNKHFVKGWKGKPILTKKDANYFIGKRVYAYVCNSFESHIFDKAIESITYYGKFYFPKGAIRPRDATFEVLELGFYPLNRGLELMLYNGYPNLKKVFSELTEQYKKAIVRVPNILDKDLLHRNLLSLRYRSKFGVSFIKKA